MKTLETSKEDALKAYKKATKKEKSLLENLFGKDVFAGDITDRVKTFEGACEVLGLDTTLPDMSAIAQKHQKALIAHYKLIIIAEALNEGWEPDWGNSNEYKYYAWFDVEPKGKKGSGFGLSGTNYGYTLTITDVGSRLCFKSEKLARYAGEKFEKLYEEYFLMG